MIGCKEAVFINSFLFDSVVGAMNFQTNNGQSKQELMNAGFELMNGGR